MRDESFFLGRPISSLQAMLREISFVHPVLPRLSVSGVFDELTLEAVMVFQREFAPPVTGTVSRETWEAITHHFHRARKQLAPPRPIGGFPHPDHQIVPGDSGPAVLLLQSMFCPLAALLDGLEPLAVTGDHIGPSVRNAQWLQRTRHRPETGMVTKADWDLLSQIYEAFVLRAVPPPLNALPPAVSPHPPGA